MCSYGFHSHNGTTPPLFALVAMVAFIRNDTTRSLIARPGFTLLEVLVVLILLLLGALPLWPYSSGWGYYPSGGLGILVLILIILLLTGRL